ncbi:Helix-turn-helix domain-containing protein [Saccharopolyspora shandongensis]|uniref:Helix-turn-helix domain-containing protein n=1 Tax=Saccharopolyspora shandongensis TaxID=418495 RepID=A0A1H3M0N6_9PSEU|nr:helix-turn-helix transcriptional regulator [Saccharopolyspora shandongensis]SDY70260.1 Helix-turn-helix domain-containing protein [Saccharopolyspora shandongensis]
MSTSSAAITMQQRQLGNELRKLRDAAGLTQEEAAQHLGKAHNKISRVENGKVSIAKVELEALLSLYQASEKDKVWCRELAKGARRHRGRPRDEAALYLGPKWFRAFRDFEQSATQVMMVASEVTPGILQTEDYIRAMFAGRGNDPNGKAVEDTVRIRQERRAILTRESAPHFSFVLSESTLRRQIGDPTVMREQLAYLAEVALLPNVTLQVIPFSTRSYVDVGYDFVIFRFDQDTSTDIVYIEIYGDAIYIDKPPEAVRRYTDLLSQLYGIALGPVESRNFVLEVADQLAGSNVGKD